MLKANGFTVQRSDISGNRCAIDQTIERTINKSAKCAGGIIGFSWQHTLIILQVVHHQAHQSFLLARDTGNVGDGAQQ